MKMQTELEQRLKVAMQNQKTDDNSMHLQEVIAEMNKVNINHKARKQIGFAAFFVRQLKFLSIPIWLVQGGLLLVLIGVLNYACDPTVLFSGRQIAFLLMGSSLLVCMTAVPFVERSMRYKMNEIEAATYVSVQKLLLTKLLIIGIGDGVMLMSLLSFMVFNTEVLVSTIILYLLLPFLLISSVVLYLLGHVSIEKFKWNCLGAGVIVFSLSVVLLDYCSWFFEQSFTIVGSLLCILLVGICAMQIRHLSTKTAFIELQLI